MHEKITQTSGKINEKITQTNSE